MGCFARTSSVGVAGTKQGGVCWSACGYPALSREHSCAAPRRIARLADEPWHTAGLAKPTSTEQDAVARSTTRLRKTMDLVRSRPGTASGLSSAETKVEGARASGGFPPTDRPVNSGLGPWLTSRTAPAAHSGRGSEPLAGPRSLPGSVQTWVAGGRHRRDATDPSTARRDRPHTAGPGRRPQNAGQTASLGIFARSLTATEAQEHRQRFRDAKPSMGMPAGKLTRTAQSWADPEALARSVKPALGSRPRSGRASRHPARRTSVAAPDVVALNLPRISLDFDDGPLLAGAGRASPSSAGSHNVSAFLASAAGPHKSPASPLRHPGGVPVRARDAATPTRPGMRSHRKGGPARTRRAAGSAIPPADAGERARPHLAASPGPANLALAPGGEGGLRPASAARSHLRPLTSPVDSAEDCLFHHHGVGAFRRGVLAVSSPETAATPSALSTIGNSKASGVAVPAATGHAVTGYFAVRVNSRTALMHAQRQQARQAQRLEQLEHSRAATRRARRPVGGADSRLPLGPSF